jgi:hypothetical protein
MHQQQQNQQQMAGTNSVKINLVETKIIESRNDDVSWVNAVVMTVQSTNALYFMVFFASKCLDLNPISTPINRLESI